MRKRIAVRGWQVDKAIERICHNEVVDPRGLLPRSRWGGL